jgi:hypothetical protein
MTFVSAVMIALTRGQLLIRPHFRVAILATAMILMALAASCEDYVNPININPVVNGTPSGNYSIVLTGTLGNGSNVTRTTTVQLTVVP